MQRTRNQHVSHARLVSISGSCAPLMPSVSQLFIMRDRLSMTWILLAVILVALITVACLSFQGRGVSTKSVSSFTPNPMNDKIILVKGWNEIKIQKIINDFIETYKGDGYPAYAIEPHKQEENVFRLTFPKDIHPTLFTFLVNYLAYPFDLDFKNPLSLLAGRQR